MLEKPELSKLLKIIKSASNRVPEGKLAIQILAGQIDNKYYTVFIGITSDEDVSNLIIELLDYIGRELSIRLGEGKIEEDSEEYH